MRDQQLAQLAKLIEIQTLERLTRKGGYPGVEKDAKVAIRPGSKYTKVDVGTSGKYMVDADGNIWGIKAYGVIHRGHHYGTLDTIDQWHWGEYRATKKP